MAFAGVFRVLFFRPDNPALGLGYRADHTTHGANKGLHVLDRHHPADQADDFWNALRPLLQRVCPGLHGDAVGNHLRTRRLRTIGDLSLTVPAIERDDGIGRTIGQQADAFEKTDPQATDTADLGIQPCPECFIRAFRDPVGLRQVDLAFLGVDTVLAEQV
ncbi:hypothetical protein D9M68_753620 [compost metagenome]